MLFISVMAKLNFFFSVSWSFRNHSEGRNDTTFVQSFVLIYSMEELMAVAEILSQSAGLEQLELTNLKTNRQRHFFHLQPMIPSSQRILNILDILSHYSHIAFSCQVYPRNREHVSEFVACVILSCLVYDYYYCRKVLNISMFSMYLEYNLT